MKVLLSIKPQFVQEMISGNKKYEYRKRIFRREVESVIVYSTMPVGKIIGEFKIENIINDTPEKIWSKTHKYSGISKDFFMKYFHNKDQGYALKIKDLNIFDEPIDPKKDIENFTAPQSFKYVDANFA